MQKDVDESVLVVVTHGQGIKQKTVPPGSFYISVFIQGTSLLLSLVAPQHAPGKGQRTPFQIKLNQQIFSRHVPKTHQLLTCTNSTGLA